MRGEREGEWKIRDWQVMQVVTEKNKQRDGNRKSSRVLRASGRQTEGASGKADKNSQE